MKKRYYWAALASIFVVGLGQLLKGEGHKALLLILAFYFTFPALIYLTLMFNAYLFLSTLGLGIIGGIVLWSYNVLDAWSYEAVN